MTLYTIGHSTRSADEFLTMLQESGIQSLVDVRRFPMSRRYPHFNEAALQELLGGVGMDYRHMAELGGRRKSPSASHNLAWRNESFRG